MSPIGRVCTCTCIVDSRVGHPSNVPCVVIAAVHGHVMVGVAPVRVVAAHFMGVQRGRNVALGRRLVLDTPTMVVTVMGLRLAVVSGPPCGGMMVWGTHASTTTGGRSGHRHCHAAGHGDTLHGSVDTACHSMRHMGACVVECTQGVRDCCSVDVEWCRAHRVVVGVEAPVCCVVVVCVVAPSCAGAEWCVYEGGWQMVM